MSSSNSIYGIIDRLRVHLLQLSDDTEFTDELLYATLLDHRNLLLHRELEKNRSWSPFLLKTICMPLVTCANVIPCDCIPEGVGCIVLKSKYKVPKPLRLKRQDVLRVTTLDGYDEIPFSELVKGKYRKYRRTKADEAYYTIYDEYLYVIGYPNNDLAGVLINIILEDPCQADNITMCDKDGISMEETCFDPLIDTFQLDGYLISPLIELSLKTLGFSLGLSNDVSNNASSTPMVQKSQTGGT